MFSIKEYLKTRPLSPSALSSWEYDREAWYDSYILGKRQKSKEMDFGSLIDQKIQDEPTFLPELPRYEHMQYKMRVMLDKDTPLVGVADGMNFTIKKELADYKTGKKKWDKKRADETLQLTFYLLLVYIIHKVKPEEFDCYIHWLQTTEGGDFQIDFIKDMKVKTFKTKRTMTDILKLAVHIKATLKEMEEFVLAKQGSSGA